MTRTSIWIARRPEDELADAIAADDRRKTLDGLIRHIVVDDAPEPTGGECSWCPKRRQLATMPDGAQRMPQFSRLMASPGIRRVIGEPCERCVKTAMGTLKRRVDQGRPKTSGDATRGVGRLTNVPRGAQSAGASSGASTLARPRTRVASPGLHDPFGTCTTCRDYRRAYPGTALTAGGFPEGCPPHAWNEQPIALRAWMRR